MQTPTKTKLRKRKNASARKEAAELREIATEIRTIKSWWGDTHSHVEAFLDVLPNAAQMSGANANAQQNF